MADCDNKIRKTDSGSEAKIDECKAFLRRDDVPDELKFHEYELLNGKKVRADIRCKLARTTKNEKVLWLCIEDKAITVVRAAKDNPLLTPAMISKIKKAEENHKNGRKETPQKNESSGKCCIWIIIIAGTIACLIECLSDEAWFPL